MVYAIVGPTGVGKTKLSILLAKKINAEIINCDSMQVYKNLDIGTAKITKDEMDGVKHHMIDVASIDEEYNAFLYQKKARFILDRLISKNKNVVIVGGTGLYLKALLYDYKFDDDSGKDNLLYNVKIIGLTMDRDKLYGRINNRVDQMIEKGLLNEVKDLYDSGKLTRSLKTAIGYKELFEYYNNEVSLDEAIDKIKQGSRRYAKRQYTFFNNQFNNIEWFDIDKISLEDIIKKVS